MKIELNHQIAVLDASGAIFLESHKILLIADVHLGKVSHFRKHGSAVPVAIVADNFEKLDAVVSKFEPKIICFLGDLFHSDYNTEWLFFEAWIKQYPKIYFQLVVGNHDIIDSNKFLDLGIRIVDSLEVEQLFLTHEPTEKEGYLNLCGHIHPAVQLHGKGKQFLKLSCFYKTRHQLILPAFGGFTGRFVLNINEAESVFGIAEQEIIQLK